MGHPWVFYCIHFGSILSPWRSPQVVLMTALPMRSWRQLIWKATECYRQWIVSRAATWRVKCWMDLVVVRPPKRKHRKNAGTGNNGDLMQWFGIYSSCVSVGSGIFVFEHHPATDWIILVIFHLQQVLESDVKQIPKTYQNKTFTIIVFSFAWTNPKTMDIVQDIQSCATWIWCYSIYGIYIYIWMYTVCMSMLFWLVAIGMLVIGVIIL